MSLIAGAQARICFSTFAAATERKNQSFAASVAAIYATTMAITAATCDAGSGTKPNTELSAPKKGIVKVAMATASVEPRSSRLGVLRAADLWVRRTSTTASSVNREIRNQEVWNVASSARNTSSSIVNVNRSNTELIKPK